MDWHRLFGLLLTDFFTDSPFSVELEKDRSVQQFLDVVVVRQRPGRVRGRLPDGLEGLLTHNLVTFKSLHEALGDWTLKELTAHYASYCKHISPSRQALLPEEQFGLYAVCCRPPHNLISTGMLERVQSGAYDCPPPRSRRRAPGKVAGRASKGAALGTRGG